MSENTLISRAEGVPQISFTSYIKEKYNFHQLFLPKHKPANDIVSAEELKELDRLIENRDHFEIRRAIASRYFDEN